MLSIANAATPFTAATVVVPASVAPVGFVPTATVTLPLNPVAGLPFASRAITCTDGVIAWPATASLGWTEKTRRAAAAAVTLNTVLVAAVSPDPVAARV